MKSPDIKRFPSNENENNLWIQCAIELLPELFPAESSFSPQAVLSLLTVPHTFVLSYAALGFEFTHLRSVTFWIASFRRLDRSYSCTETGAACYLSAAAAALCRVKYFPADAPPEASWCANHDRLAPGQAVECLPSKVRPRKA